MNLRLECLTAIKSMRLKYDLNEEAFRCYWQQISNKHQHEVPW